MEDILAGLSLVLNVTTIFWVSIGAILGIVLGALPGLTATMGVALMLPVSLFLPTATGMAMLMGVYSGAVAGASIPAILLGIPGNPNALATVTDGYQMSRKGLAGQALGGATLASLIGGLLSLGALVLFAPLLARATLAFGPAEKFSLALLGLSIIVSIAGDNLMKGFILMFLGICLALIGTDPFTNAPRVPFPYLFASTPLQNGISLVPALIGLFGISQAFFDLDRLKDGNSDIPVITVRKLFPSMRKLAQMWRLILDSTVIGTIIGAIPGTGASIAVFISYERARKLTNAPGSSLDKVGTGCLEGVFAPEVTNNAVTGGALIPLLTLGIPGDSTTAVLLGALLIKGVIPGHELFTHNMPLVHAIFFGMAFSLVAMFVFQLLGIRLFPYVLKVPISFLIPIIVILSYIGTFAIEGQAVIVATYNMCIAFLLGFLGFLCKKTRYPISPLVLGLILGGMLEENFRLAIKLGRGDYLVFFRSPIVLAMLAVTVLALFWPTLARRRQARKP